MPSAYLELMYHMVGPTDFLLWEIGAALRRGNFGCSLWASEFNLVRLFLANGSIESVLVIVPVIMLHVIEEHQDRVNGAGSFHGILLHSPWCINPCSNRRDHSFRVWYPINVSLHSGSHHSKYF
ncbi:30S ribosomal protein [Actinidia chinensis var. chinensis]|uniref:30S ribosomal protein n=1 Tax=Actinidia chinensis var. chinensis TaxID=1590841 RepID=A0A2R6S2I8_ACTCC|nr:30S ribosomal protein [Actinidia chinensis var. chinensis]